MILPSQKAKQKRKRTAKPDAADNKVASAAKKSKVPGAAKKAAKATPEPLSEAEKEKAAKRSMLRLVQSVVSVVINDSVCAVVCLVHNLLNPDETHNS